MVVLAPDEGDDAVILGLLAGALSRPCADCRQGRPPVSHPLVRRGESILPEYPMAILGAVREASGLVCTIGVRARGNSGPAAEA